MAHGAEPDSTAATTLVERGHLLTTLNDIQASVATRGGWMVWVGGEAGVGKTTLVTEFVARTRTRVLAGACDGLATPRPLGPLRDIASAGATRVADAFTAGAARHTLFEAMLDELSSPTLAVIEDVHWADEATVDLLRFLGRRITRTRSVVLVTYRNDEVDGRPQLRAVLGDLAAALGCRRIGIEPLSVDGVRELVAGGAVDPIRLHDVTGGNPFYVTEALAAPDWSVPPTVADAVAARASRLNPGGRAALDAVAIEPAGMEWWLAEVLGASPEGIQEAVDAGMLVERRGVLRFRHELARLAIEDRLRPDQRQALHQSALAALRDRPIDAARLAQHAELADAGDDVLRWAPIAADEAVATGAHTEAAAQYQRALRRVPAADPSGRADLLTCVADQLDILDRVDEALAARKEALALYRRAGDESAVAVALADAARTMWRSGRGDEAYQTVAAAVSAVDWVAGEDADVAPARARVLMAQALLHMLGRRASAIRAADRAIEAAEEAGDSYALARALDARGSARLVMNEDLDGVDDLERSRRIGVEQDWDNVASRALVNSGSGLGEIHRAELAERYLVEALELAQARDLDADRRYAQAWLARVRFELGRWDEAEELITSEFDRDDVSPSGRIVALTVLARVRARRGEPSADEPLRRAWPLAVATGDLQRLWPVVVGRAELTWLAGHDDEQLRDELGGVLDLARRLRCRLAVGELGWWEWKLGWRSGPLDEDAADVYAALVAGETAHAVEYWQAVPAPYEVALALADSGDEPALRTALDMFIALGAAPMATRVRRELAELGARDVPRGPRPATASSPAGLTARELDVLELVADGLTNKQIAARLHVSARTVGHHVAAILRKLDARTRTEAAAAYHEIT